MPSAKWVLTVVAISMVTMAVVHRVGPVRQIVTGS